MKANRSEGSARFKQEVLKSAGEGSARCNQDVSKSAGEGSARCNQDVLKSAGEGSARCNQDVLKSAGEGSARCNQGVLKSAGEGSARCNQGVLQSQFSYSIPKIPARNRTQCCHCIYNVSKNFCSYFDFFQLITLQTCVFDVIWEDIYNIARNWPYEKLF